MSGRILEPLFKIVLIVVVLFFISILVSATGLGLHYLAQMLQISETTFTNITGQQPPDVCITPLKFWGSVLSVALPIIVIAIIVGVLLYRHRY